MPINMGNAKRDYPQAMCRTLKLNANKRERQMGAHLQAEAFAFMAMRPRGLSDAPKSNVAATRKRMRTIQVAYQPTPLKTVEHTFYRNVFHARPRS